MPVRRTRAMNAAWQAKMRAHEYDGEKHIYKACAGESHDSNMHLRATAHVASRPPVIRCGSWLTSAKGGDPMSHGSAERSASFRARHYR